MAFAPTVLVLATFGSVATWAGFSLVDTLGLPAVMGAGPRHCCSLAGLDDTGAAIAWAGVPRVHRYSPVTTST